MESKDEVWDDFFIQLGIFLTDVEVELQAGRLGAEDLSALFDENLAGAADTWIRGKVRYCGFCRWLVKSNLLEVAKDQLEKAEQEVRSSEPDSPESKVLLSMILADRALTIANRKSESNYLLCQAIETLLDEAWSASLGSLELLRKSEEATFEGWNEDQRFAFAFVCFQFARVGPLMARKAGIIEAIRWLRTGQRCSNTLPVGSGGFNELKMQAPMIQFTLMQACEPWFPDQDELELLWGDDFMSDADGTHFENAFEAALELRTQLPISTRIAQLMQVAINGTEIDENTILELKEELGTEGSDLDVAELAYLLGLVLLRRKELTAACEQLKAAWETFDRVLEPGHLWLPPVSASLAGAYRAHGDHGGVALSYGLRSLSDFLLAGIDLRLCAGAIHGVALSLQEAAPEVAAFLAKIAANSALWFDSLMENRLTKPFLDLTRADLLWSTAKLLAFVGRTGEALHSLYLHGAVELRLSAESRGAAMNLPLGPLPMGPIESMLLQRLAEVSAELNRTARESLSSEELRLKLAVIPEVVAEIQAAFRGARKTIDLEINSLQDHLLQQQFAKYPNHNGDTAMIAFVCSNSGLRVALVLANKVEIFDNPNTYSDLAKVIWDLLRCLIARTENDPWTDFREPAGRLAEILFHDIDLDWLASIGVSRLVIRPTGPLIFVPFCALINGGRFLIEKFILAFDAHIPLDFERKVARPTRVALLGATFESAGTLSDLAELPGVAAELDSLRTVFNLKQNERCEIFESRDQEFDFDALTTVLVGGYELIHLATHFKANSADPSESAILLGNCRKVSLAEIRGFCHRLDAVDLIVLSACSSMALSDGLELEIHSTAELLHSLGARAVVGSLWRVDDVSTAQLMRDFYARMFNGTASIAKDEALRDAQLALLESEKFRHPYYWAAFALSGNWLGFGVTEIGEGLAE